MHFSECIEGWPSGLSLEAAAFHLICARSDFHLGFHAIASRGWERNKRWVLVSLVLLLHVLRTLM